MFLISNDEGDGGFPAGRRCLEGQGTALEAVESCIRPVEEDDTVRSVGRGGAPNLLGVVECDAAIMDGATLRTGAVGALRGFLHAISAARLVMERLPHVMLVGDGAARFAREMGLTCADMLTDEAGAAYRRWVGRRVPADCADDWRGGPLSPYAWPSSAERPGGTVICLAGDRDGHLAAGASTSGWAYKYPGRLGDSPIIGAGIYADDRYGACGCTHTGEMTMRCCTARSVVLYMKRGAGVVEACHEAAQDLHDLRGGFIGPVVIHAIDRDGAHCAL
ncbi:MAG: isoaspartyl peptidase/L-asparaginase, partial [Candidatus Eisenbacteria bacterium]|nr:isoaspartyl peptidase/L-asparaginase [Candidatus Eisenbacteria bacterium]